MTEEESTGNAAYERGRLAALQHMLHLVVATMPQEARGFIEAQCLEHARKARHFAEARQNDALLDEAAAAWDVAEALGDAMVEWPSTYGVFKIV